eukprot:439785-Prorocentrum_minimum.AAC.1
MEQENLIVADVTEETSLLPEDEEKGKVALAPTFRRKDGEWTPYGFTAMGLVAVILVAVGIIAGIGVAGGFSGGDDDDDGDDGGDDDEGDEVGASKHCE